MAVSLRRLFPLRPDRSWVFLARCRRRVMDVQLRVVGGELSLLARIRFFLEHRGRIDVGLCSFDEGLVLVMGPFTRKMRVAVRPHRSQFYRRLFAPIGWFPLPPQPGVVGETLPYPAANLRAKTAVLRRSCCRVGSDNSRGC